MHPAIPVAGQFLAEHTHRLLGVLEQRQQQKHGLRLAAMLKEVISDTRAAITEKQIEVVSLLTRQTQEEFQKNLAHYMSEREKFSNRYLDNATSDAMRLEIDGHIIHIDDQMKAIRRDMDALTRFCANFARICGEAGFKFVQDLSVPYTTPTSLGG